MMLKEDLSLFKDGVLTDEKDVATVVASLEDTVIFQDDSGSLFFLSADPSCYEIGDVEAKGTLSSVETAPDPLKEMIYAAVDGREQ